MIVFSVSMSCLGIFVGHDKERNEKLNWFDKIEKVRQLISSCSKRDLSTYGKVQIIKSFAVSQLEQVESLIPVPSGIGKSIYGIFFKYIFNSEDKVKRMNLLKPSKAGGINMTDIESMLRALKASWILRLYAADPVKQSWAQLAHFFHFKSCAVRTFSIMCDHTPFYACKSPDQTSGHT